MMRAKPHIPEMRQNQSGDEYQADDQVAGRPTISPLPLLQGGALLFALHILLALEIYIWWPSVAVIVSRYSYFRGGGPFFFSQHDTFSFHFSTQLPSLLFRHHVHVEWVWFHRLCHIPGDWTEPRLTAYNGKLESNDSSKFEELLARNMLRARLSQLVSMATAFISQVRLASQL